MPWEDLTTEILEDFELLAGSEDRFLEAEQFVRVNRADKTRLGFNRYDDRIALARWNRLTDEQKIAHVNKMIIGRCRWWQGLTEEERLKYTHERRSEQARRWAHMSEEDRRILVEKMKRGQAKAWHSTSDEARRHRIENATRKASATKRKNSNIKMIEWDQQPLGMMSDSELARRLGCHPSSVVAARQKRGISKFVRHAPSAGAIAYGLDYARLVILGMTSRAD